MLHFLSTYQMTFVPQENFTMARLKLPRVAKSDSRLSPVSR